MEDHSIIHTETGNSVFNLLPAPRAVQGPNLLVSRRMKQNRRVAPLVRLTIVILVIYAPIETWYSLPALWSPFYLVDFIGMVLLAWGAARCRRDPSPASLAVLGAGYAWEGANFWRALFGRVEAIVNGEQLQLGWAELCFVVCGTIAALVGLVWSLRLATTAHSPENTGFIM
jgi:hypothetical protein